MTLQEIKLAIWNSKQIHRNQVDLQVYADKAGVRLPITDIREAEKLLKSLTRKIKRKVETPKWCIDRYEAAHKAHFALQYPHAWKDGHYVGMEPEWPDVGLTNGLTTFVSNFIVWSGGYANRINVAGRQIGGITKTQSGATFDDRKFITSSTKKGTEDLDCVYQGRKIAIEIKNRVTKDTLSDDQKKQRRRIEAAGGIYWVVDCPETFLELWDKIVSSISIQASLL